MARFSSSTTRFRRPAAYDYTADTRGYTYGFLTEFYDPGWALRFGEMLMPKVANGIELDWNVAGRAPKTSNSSSIRRCARSTRGWYVFCHSSITPTWAATAKRLARSWADKIRRRI